MRTAKTRQLRGWGACMAALVFITVSAGVANAVQIDIPDTSGVAGDTVDVRVTTTDLTGLEVYSYEFDLTYDADYLTLIDVIESGTLTEPWGDATLNSGIGGARVVSAGAQPLSGAGDLVHLRFVLGPSSGGMWVLFDDFLFNEGIPEDTTSNGYITVYAAPTISIVPNSGEIVVGDSVQFSVSGGTPPYTWGSTDSSVALPDADGWLHGVSVGVCRVFAADSVGVRDTTDGDINVRAMRLRAPDGMSAAPEDTFDIPIEVTDVSGLGIHSLEFTMTFTSSRFEVLEASEIGTLSEAWGPPETLIEPGLVSVATAGSDTLTGSGVIVVLRCCVPSGASGETSLDLTYGFFDETYIPLLDDGYFTIDAPPGIFITPDTAELLVGDTLSFNVGGSPVPPFDWESTDHGVGTIDTLGVFTAVGGGVCNVHVEDAASARDTSGIIRVYDLLVYAPDDSLGQGDPARAIPILVDRDVTGMSIRGYEVTITFDSDYVHAVALTDSGSISDPWGVPTYNIFDDSVKVAHAGTAPLEGVGPIFHIYLAGDVAAPIGETSYLNVANAYFNEGDPIAATENGTLQIIESCAGNDGGEFGPLGFHLEQNWPNPFIFTTAIRFRIPQPGRVVLTVHDVSGKRIAVLQERHCPAGASSRTWDGRDDAGLRVGPGIYFVNMEAGAFTATRKAVLIQ